MLRYLLFLLFLLCVSVSASSSNGTAGSALSVCPRKHAILHKWLIVCSLFVAENNGDDWAIICSCWYAFHSSRREEIGRCVAFRLMMGCSFHHIDSDDAVMIVGE
jgi:hypothetical protein